MTKDRIASWWRRIGLGGLLIAAGQLPATTARAAERIEPAMGIDLGLMHSTAVTPEPVLTFALIPVVGGMARLALGPAVVGVRGDVAHDVIFGRSEAFLVGFAGVRIAAGDMEALATAEGGEHYLSDVGASFLNSVHADTAALPFVGGRLELAHAEHVHRDLLVSLAAFGRWDLRHQLVTSTPTDTNCFVYCTHDPASTFDTGGMTLGMSLGFALRPPARGTTAVN